MDREIDLAFRRKLFAKRTVISLLLVSAIAALLIFGPAWIKPSLSRNRIRTAKVESGSIEASSLIKTGLESQAHQFSDYARNFYFVSRCVWRDRVRGLLRG